MSSLNLLVAWAKSPKIPWETPGQTRKKRQRPRKNDPNQQRLFQRKHAAVAVPIMEL